MSKTTNFRLSLLQKISGSGVDGGEALSSESVRKALEEQILKSETDIDLTKLSQFAIRYSIPSFHRVTVWKLLLGISSPYPQIKATVAAHRQEEAQLLLRSLRLMQKSPLGRSFGEYHETVTASDLIGMMQMADPSVPLVTSVRPRTRQGSVKAAADELIARSMCQICGDENLWVDAYWLTLKLHEILQTIFASTELLSNLLHDIYAHVRALQSGAADEVQNREADRTEDATVQFPFPRADQLELWFRSGGASLLSNEALQKLWDKICTRDAVSVLLKSVMIELLSVTHRHFRSARKGSEQHVTVEALIRGCITRDLELKIVSRATDTVMKSGLFGSRKQS